MSEKQPDLNEKGKEDLAKRQAQMESADTQQTVRQRLMNEMRGPDLEKVFAAGVTPEELETMKCENRGIDFEFEVMGHKIDTSWQVADKFMFDGVQITDPDRKKALLEKYAPAIKLLLAEANMYPEKDGHRSSAYEREADDKITKSYELHKDVEEEQAEIKRLVREAEKLDQKKKYDSALAGVDELLGR